MCREYLWDKKKCGIVAWKDVCLPKHQGGLGLRDFGVWNRAILAKQIWNFHSKKDTLWVRWFHSYYLKGQSIWEWEPNKEASAYARGLRDVRNELSTLSPEVASLIEKLRGWVAPKKGLQMAKVYEAIYPLTVWSDRRSPSISTDHIYSTIWKSYIPPKLSFIAWLATKGRLWTKDRIGRWRGRGEAENQEEEEEEEDEEIEDVECNLCSFCDLEYETTAHLFFQCPFTREIWDRMREWLQLSRRAYTLKTADIWIKRSCKGSGQRRKAGPLALIASIYHIWTERNEVSHKIGVRPSIDRVEAFIKRDCYTVLHHLYPNLIDF